MLKITFQDQLLSYAVIFFVCIGLAAIIDGLLIMFVDQKALFIYEDVLYIGMSADEIIAYNPQLYTWVAVVYRLWGTFLVMSGLLVTALAVVPLRKKERWAWYLLAATTVPALISWIYFVIPFDSYFFTVLGTATAICSAALILSYPALFSARPESTQ